jgi:predicted O-methyltransferase YrrM
MVKRTGLLLAAARVVDILALPFTGLAGVWLKFLRTFGFQYLPASKRMLLSIGVLPVRDHYYEPMINSAHLRYALSKDRELPGIDLNVAEQLTFIGQFTFREELLGFPLVQKNRLEFYYHNGSFVSGDAEYLYSLVRLVKPRKIIEIGCGYSTVMTRNAVDRNKSDDASYSCDHICIEPYEQPWLEELGVQVIRRRVEECDIGLFASLEKGDILFIDSSHVIRPQGDVLFEYLEVLPMLKPGVFVHVHDIFTPRDYLQEWIVDEMKLWNEQYLLEAFLSFNKEFRVIGAVNFLKHNHPAALAERFPILEMEIGHREPGSFWIVRQ